MLKIDRYVKYIGIFTFYRYSQILRKLESEVKICNLSYFRHISLSANAMATKNELLNVNCNQENERAFEIGRKDLNPLS